MNAALEVMYTFRQPRDLGLATLNDSSLSHRDIRKAADAFWDRVVSCIEPCDEAATKFFHFSEGVRFAALIANKKSSAFFDFQPVGLKVPARIWRSSSCLCKQILQRGRESKRGECDILAEVSPEGRIKGERIAFVQRYDQCGTW